MLFNETIVKHKSDAVSILLWVNNLKVEVNQSKPGCDDENKIKASLLSKLDTLEANALSLANYYSDCEASFQDQNILQDILADLQV